jgi:hypothetical protein
MYRLLTAFAAFLVLAAGVSPAAPIPEEARDPVLYHPTRVGDRMTYQLPQGEVVHVVTAVEAKGDALVVTVGGAVFPGGVAREWKVEVSTRGVSLLGVDLPGAQVGTERWAEVAPPRCLLKLPSVPGESWRWGGTHGPVQSTVLTAGRPEVVKIPAGVFAAVTVDSTYTPFAFQGSIRGRYWYAPGVGEVKRASADGEVESVLKSFTPGKR